jgi:amidohydrolase
VDENIIKKCTVVRHKLHQMAEPSNKEIETKKFLIEFLEKNSCLEIHDEGKWFYAVYRAKEKGPGIAFRSEIDAVPVKETTDLAYKSLTEGMSHTCGHDGHCAALLATALHIERTGANCDVYFLFQHAEEIGAGAKECLKMLEENDIAEIYGCHNAPGIKLGKVIMNKKGLMNWASTGVIVRFEGTPSHASMPEVGRNPAFCVADIIKMLPDLEKEASKKGKVLSTIIQIDIGEESFGVQASDGVFCLTFRGEYEEELDWFRTEFEHLVANLACNNKINYQIQYQDEFPITINTQRCMECVKKSCDNLNVEFEYTEDMDRGSEDFGWYTKKIDGAIFHIGAGENHAELHTGAFDFPDDLIEKISDVFCEIVRMFK